MHKKENIRDKFPLAPISPELWNFLENRPEVFKAMKLCNMHRFDFLHVITCSHTPDNHPRCKDEVIGLWYLDRSGSQCKRHKKICWFKQDFVVNLNKKNKEYVIYSSDRDEGKYVKPIKDFFNHYGDNGKYYWKQDRWEHHYGGVEDLPKDEMLINNARIFARKRNIQIK